MNEYPNPKMLPVQLPTASQNPLSGKNAATVARDEHDGLREDDRHHAGGIHPEREVLRRPAVDAAADDALGVLHRDPPRALGHEH